MVEHVLSKMEQQHVPVYLDTMDQFANKVDDILLLRARPLSSGVTIHIPCDSISIISILLCNCFLILIT